MKISFDATTLIYDYDSKKIDENGNNVYQLATIDGQQITHINIHTFINKNSIIINYCSRIINFYNYTIKPIHTAKSIIIQFNHDNNTQIINSTKTSLKFQFPKYSIKNNN